MWRTLKTISWNWRGVLFTVPSMAGIVCAIRLLGWLQPIEWLALDLFFRLRPLESVDPQIVIVSIEESDIAQLGKWPISDATLAQLITKIKQHQPSVIGLDLYRNLPVEPGHQALIQVFQTTPNLIGIEKTIGDPHSAAIDPAPALKQLGRVSANDIVVDADGRVRRAILFPIPEGNEEIPSLGLAVALRHLERQQILPETAAQGALKLRSAVFFPLEENDGSYVRTDAGGYQILLNYRGPAHSFRKVTLTQVLNDQIPVELMRNRIVLVGTEAASLNDAFLTPYSGHLTPKPILTSGVEIQANIASHLLNAALFDRPNLRTWADPLEYGWIVAWSLVGTVLCWKWREEENAVQYSQQMAALICLSGIGLIVGGYGAFLISWWIPIVPPILALTSSVLWVTGYIYVNKLQELNTILEKKVVARTHELQEKNEQLTTTLEELQTTQHLLKEKNFQISQALAKERELNELKSRFVSTMSHEFLTPLGTVLFSTSLLKQHGHNWSREKQIKHLDRIQLIVQHLSQSVRDVLLLSKTEEKFTFEPTPLDLQGFCQSLVAEVQATQRHPCPIALTLTPDPTAPTHPICLDSRLLRLILTNLLSNAIKYSTSGDGIDLIISHTPREISFQVKDQGIGIPATAQSYLFEPFYRGQNVGEISGNGLGLAIVKRLVDLHQGTISIDSELGVGTTATVLIPLIPSALYAENSYEEDSCNRRSGV
ncbi:MAG: CHASE2 domain-containing protein [Leptolyngbyaceae cyanobacterium bins.59]|nr:CHASE2 domain-containing protein [Leptolyngbyaceae cyanobacterium bins.59]